MDRNSHIMLTKKVHNAINYNYTILVLILLFDEYNLCYDNKFTRFLFKFFKSNNIEPLALKKKTSNACNSFPINPSCFVKYKMI